MLELMKETDNSLYSNIGRPISGRILMAEDYKLTQDVVSEFLKFWGFEVAIANNGVEALAAFLENDFDLVLTDLQMPAMDGLTLAGHIKDRSPHTPVILMTGSDKETLWDQEGKKSFDSVIYKPFLMEELQRTVQETLGLIL
jgi:CheY-like chemotaxis protein